MARSRIVSAWMLAWLSVLLWLTAPMAAQSPAPNNHQFGLTVTNAAVVQLTVPAGTTACTIAVRTNTINWDIGTTATNAAPTTTAGIPATAGAVVNLNSFVLCRNFGAMASGANATLDTEYFR